MNNLIKKNFMGNQYFNRDQRINELLYKMQANKATTAEKKEYVTLLLNGGYIDTAEFEKHMKDLDKANFTPSETLIGIGVAIFLGALLAELFKKN